MQLKYTYNSVFPGLQLRAPLPVYYHGANLKGFQGQEKDDELKGAGNSVNYTYRMHDPRLGRFFAVDPLSAEYPFYSPYAFSGNRVVDSKELEGLEPASIHVTWIDEDGSRKSKFDEANPRLGYFRSDYLEDVFPKCGLRTMDYPQGSHLRIVINRQKGDVGTLCTPVTVIHGKRKERSKVTKWYQVGGQGPFIAIRRAIFGDASADKRLKELRDLDNALDGERGLVLYADKLDAIGDKLQYVPIPIINRLGTGLCISSDGIKSGLDYKNEDFDTASKNAGIRFATTVFQNLYGKAIKKASLNKGMDYIHEQTIRKATDALKNEATTDNYETEEK